MALFRPICKPDDRHRLFLDVSRRMKRYAGRSLLWKICFYLARVQYQTLVLYRLHHGANSPVLRIVWGLGYRISSLISGLEISCPDFGGGVIVPHWGRTIINAEKVGKDLYIFHGVTIGNDYRTGCPSFGDNVFVGTGAIVLGKIVIGDNVVIGAGSVVIRDVPAGSVVAGNPARVVGDSAKRPITLGY